MAVPAEYVKMGDMAKLEGNTTLEKIKRLAIQYLPNSWEEWQVTKSYATDDIKLEVKTINKLRYAIPTLRLARSFDPNSKGLSEKSYRQYNKVMLR